MGKERYGGLLLPKGDLIQILVRLPVESLGRFKLVCKSWCTLIQTPFFIDLHNSSKFGSLILLASLDKEALPSCSLFMLSPSESDYNQIIRREVPGNGFNFDTLVGSCNGLVGLYDKRVNRVSLMNPATREFRILPEPIHIPKAYPHHHLVAFGFDVETKDYKVVIFTGFDSKYYRSSLAVPVECPCRVQVYSLSTDSWRLLEGITRLPGYPFCFVDGINDGQGQILYMNGSCFFMAHFFHSKQQPCFPENDRFIISFDFTKEIITPIQLPDHHENQKLHLSCLADKLALFTISYPPHPLLSYLSGTYSNGFYNNVYNDYNMWVLNEHGNISSTNNESWEKLRSFQMQADRPGERNYLPRGISNDGEFALLEASDLTGLGKKIILYHLVNKEVKMNNFLSCNEVMSRAHAYKPSLVSIF